MVAKDSQNYKSTSRKELHDRILQEAMTLFTKNGIKNMTMDDIATSLAISKRTLYEEVPDKAALVMEVEKLKQARKNRMIEQIIHEHDNVLRIILEIYGITIHEIQGINPDYFRDLKRYPAVNRMYEKDRERNMNSTIAFFQKGVIQGFFRNDFNYSIINYLLDAQIRSLVEVWLTMSYSFHEVFETLVFSFLRGISTASGQTLIDEYSKLFKKESLIDHI